MRPEEQRNGVTIGLVKDLDDPQKIGRVLVSFPLYDDQKSAWARVVAPAASPESGVFFRPSKNDEVLVLFEQGDPRQPYVLGALWSKTAKPPAEALPPANDIRLIRSPSGQVLRFDDKKKLVELADEKNERHVTIDTGGKKIVVEAKKGDIEVRAGSGSVVVQAKKGKVTVDARDIQLKASNSLKLEARGKVTIKGSRVDIN